ncbi:MAG: hypothetical protein KGI28_00585 [Thaumarchaeota archaeon]|nr:hypothetical protein [Nitrososphaerota archaeon]
MDELEKKKWIITRADITFNLQRQMIKEKEKEIRQFRESEIGRWKGLEKAMISIVVSGIGIIVGLHEIYPNMLNWGIPIFLISAIGLAVYLPTIVFRYINEKIFDDIVASNNASNTWHYSYGRFTTYATKIEQYSSNDFEKFLEYYEMFVTASAELSLYQSLKKHSSWLKFLFLSWTAMKKIYGSQQSLQRLLDHSSKNYKNARNQYESISMIKDLLIYGNALSRYNNGIIIIPKPKFSSTSK